MTWELQAIGDIASRLGRSQDLDGSLQVALRRLCDLFGASAAEVTLRDEETGQLRPRGQVGFNEQDRVEVVRAAADRWPSQRVLRTGAPAILADLTREGSHCRAAGGDRPLRGAASAPIFVDGELFGALSVFSEQAGRFSRADARPLAIIGHHLGMAAQSARLYARVRQAKTEWEQTVDALGDPIAVFDGDGHVVRANAAFARQIGVAVTEVLGIACDRTGLCGRPWPHCAVGRAARAREGGREEASVADGRILSVTTVPVDVPAGRVSVVQVAKDVTEERRRTVQLRAMSEELRATNAELSAALDRVRSAQAQLIQSEKLSAIGQLVAGVAHELNNPLTSVLGYAQLIQDELLDAAAAGQEGRPPAEITRDVQRIGEESERAARIVRNLLAFARRQTGERALHQIPDLVQQVLSLRAYEMRVNDIDVSVEFPAGLPPVYVDANQIQQALLNLILNAEQAMREPQRRGELTVSGYFNRDAMSIVVRVCDNGPGIAPENLARIFDPFFTTKPVGQGTGLGLSICYGIVRDHGGYLRAESEPGLYAAVSFELPARPVTGPVPAGRALVLHADPSTREFLSAALTGWGYEVAGAVTPHVAFEQMRRAPCAFALVDAGLLPALDGAGWEAAFGHQGAPPLIAVAAAGGDGRETAFGAGVRAVVSPPFELLALRSAVDVACTQCRLEPVPASVAQAFRPAEMTGTSAGRKPCATEAGAAAQVNSGVEP